MPNPQNLTPFTKDDDRAREAGKMASGENGRGPSLKTVLKRILDKDISLPEGRDKRSQALKQLMEEAGYTGKKIKIKDLLVLGDVVDAVKGNDKSRERVWQYHDGKPTQPISGDGDLGPIQIKVDM